MEYLVKGEQLSKIKAGFAGMNVAIASSCGGSDVYCSSDAGCTLWTQCVRPTTYAGCDGGKLTFPSQPVD